jgi:DNA mismatch repair protein MutL
VVKELVENALDAGARKITVEVKAGGRSLIRVTDDGHGMSRDDALMSLERHATSKITRAEDLASIATMGFRGEAVPSIASVSRFVLTSRLAEAEGGTEIAVNGGKMLAVKETGAAVGTAVEVRSLFYNLPARRNPIVAIDAKSSARVILLVACRSRLINASSRLIPCPSSVTRIKLRPPAFTSTVIFLAPASSAFSTNSFTTLAGRSTTSPAAI